MYFTRILLSIVFVLYASTALAAPPEKTLICHVGNEVGPGGEDYLDAPGCVPHDGNDWFCPDAGKIDLIEVAKRAKHLGNAAHSYDGISDYLPGDIGASGEGKEDSNGDGVDDGCEPPFLACPCWISLTEGELLTALEGAPSSEFCAITERVATAWSPDTGLELTAWAPGLTDRMGCEFRSGDADVAIFDLTPGEQAVCYAEAVAVIPQITWCDL
jgi:hypothetical protein